MFEKDCVHDTGLYKYFYKNNFNYSEFYKLLTSKTITDEERFSALTNETNTILYEQQDLTEYIMNDFKVYYIRDPNRTTLQFDNYIKKLHVITILSFISIYFYTIHNQYELILNILDLKISVMILLIPLVLSILIRQTTLRIFDDSIKINRYYLGLFWILVTLQSFIFFLLLIKNQLVFIANEVLWSKGITIIQHYTIEEKTNFLYEYLKYKLSQNELIDKIYIIDQIQYIDFIIYINNNTTLLDLKCYIDNLLPLMLKLRDLYSLNIEVLNTNILNTYDYYNNIAISLILYVLVCYWFLPVVLNIPYKIKPLLIKSKTLFEIIKEIFHI